MGLLMVMSAAIAIVFVGLGLLAYGYRSTTVDFEERVHLLETQMDREIRISQAAQSKAAEMESDLDVVTRKLGVTTQELERSRKIVADQLRESQERARQEQARLEQQQERSAAELSKQIESKASRTEVANDVNAARQEAARLQQISETKIGAVSGDVRTVASNLEATQRDVADNRRDLVDAKNTLTQQIARNSTELSELRKKGERDFFEFDIKKDKKVPMQRVADIQIGLEGTDVKNRKYEMTIQVDDNKLKKSGPINEPIQFLVGRDKLRYEVVVNAVDKDRIRGYLSVPKDKVLASEKPAFR
jgi:chromosome segregation ATPase